MSLQDKVKATAKNIEGKVQETYGDVIGDPKNQAEGKAKQTEAKVRHTVEDVKDEVKKNDRLIVLSLTHALASLILEV
jgi:uncharacterized protein YjbJ (UPF0337 family)